MKRIGSNVTYRSLHSLCFFFVIIFSFFRSPSTPNAMDVRQEDIFIYTYHTHPPFIVSSGQGLSYDLADYLSKKADGRYNFFVKPMSRPRVNKMLEESRRGIIPWVNPAWFKDELGKNYIWSDSSLMEDSNAIISHRDRHLTYLGPESFENLIFGGVRAHVYVGVDDYINRTSLAKRVDAENHIDNFRKLTKKRIDVTITPKSGAEYLIKKEGLQNVLFISPTPHSTFQRKVIIVNDSLDLFDYINGVMSGMPLDNDWLKILEKYR